MVDLNTRILGVDPSLSSTGLCLLNEHGNVITAESIHHELSDPHRLIYIEEYLRNFLNSYRPTHVIYERQVPQMRYHYNAGSILPLAELAGILKVTLLKYVRSNPSVVIYNLPPEDIKKFATGNPKATKEDVMSTIPIKVMKKFRALVPEWGLDDASDAYYASRLLYDLLKSDSSTTLNEYKYISMEVQV